MVQMIDPCGDDPNNLDEHLLVIGTSVYAYFDSQGKRFIGRLDPGIYVTTDRQSCVFQVLDSGEIIWEN